VRRLSPFARFGGEPWARGCSAAPPHASGSFGWPTFGLPVRGLALTDVLARVEADAGKALEIIKEYVRFPTISAHKRAQPETAAFVRRLLVENGFEAREYPTDGGPNVVFGQMVVDERKPTLLMNQHYDVQPVDPLNEWKRYPFDPAIEDGKLWGRGCADTKGNLIMQLLAVQAWAPSDRPRAALPAGESAQGR